MEDIGEQLSDLGGIIGDAFLQPAKIKFELSEYQKEEKKKREEEEYKKAAARILGKKFGAGAEELYMAGESAASVKSVFGPSGGGGSGRYEGKELYVDAMMKGFNKQVMGLSKDMAESAASGDQGKMLESLNALDVYNASFEGDGTNVGLKDLMSAAVENDIGSSAAVMISQENTKTMSILDKEKQDAINTFIDEAAKRTLGITGKNKKIGPTSFLEKADTQGINLRKTGRVDLNKIGLQLSGVPSKTEMQNTATLALTNEGLDKNTIANIYNAEEKTLLELLDDSNDVPDIVRVMALQAYKARKFFTAVENSKAKRKASGLSEANLFT